jgi:hypothetical protein
VASITWNVLFSLGGMMCVAASFSMLSCLFFACSTVLSAGEHNVIVAFTQGNNHDESVSTRVDAIRKSVRGIKVANELNLDQGFVQLICDSISCHDELVLELVTREDVSIVGRDEEGVSRLSKLCSNWLSIGTPDAIAFEDTDSSNGTISGTITIWTATSEHDVDYYKVYFLMETPWTVEAVGNVSATGQAMVTVNLLEKSVPFGATALVAVSGNATGETSMYSASAPRIELVDYTTTTTTTSTHPCRTDDAGCILSPGFPDIYGINTRCTFELASLPAGEPLRTTDFHTEQGYDQIIVNGLGFSGQSAPDGIVPTEPIVWTSDHSVVTTGWRLCFGTTTTTTTTTNPNCGGLRADPQYLGCYRDAGERDLPLFIGAHMTDSQCHAGCHFRGYRYAGLQSSRECWCGHSYGSHGEEASGCSCETDHIGGWRNCVYDVCSRALDQDHGDEGDDVTTTTTSGSARLLSEITDDGKRMIV